MPQEINFNQFETPQTILVNQAGFYGIERQLARERAEKYLKLLQLWDKRNEMARGLSGGMKRRLMIARALMHEPRLLILDEPTAGVDIEIRRSMWEFLREINARGTTIILTTHYLEEAENLCRNIAIIDGGPIAERDRMSSLLRKLQAETFVLNAAQPVAGVPQLPGYEFELVDDHTLEVEVSKEQSLNEVFARAVVARHRRAVDAQQGQPARRDVHAAGRTQTRRAVRHEQPSRQLSQRSPRLGCAQLDRASRPSSSASTAASCASGAQTLVPLGGHLDAVLRHLRQSDRAARRRHGRLRRTCSTSRPASS